MSSEHHDGQTTDPADKPSPAFSIPRWAALALTVLLLVPLVMMSSMMLVMSSFGPPMQAEMTAEGSGIIPVVGAIPLLVTLGVLYGMYRIYAAEMVR